MLIARRATSRFDGDDIGDEQRLLRSLNEFALDTGKRLAALESQPRTAVLDDVYLETGAALAVGTAPFPLRVQTPFSVSGLILLGIESMLGEAGILTTAVGIVGRPLTGGDVEGPGYEILYVAGLTASQKYKLRLLAVGVRNG